MLSDDKVRKAAKKFVCVKVDPRSPGDGRDALKHKTTRYVPELVILDPAGEEGTVVEDRSVDGILSAMDDALRELKSAR